MRAVERFVAPAKAAENALAWAASTVDSAMLRSGVAEWRKAPVVYRLDRDLLNALFATDLKALPPVDAFIHLPHEVFAVTFDEPVDVQRLRAYLAEPGHLMVVAVDDGIVVGQCAGVVHRHPDKVTELYVDEVGTAPSHHRRGIGRSMVEALFAWGRELGCKEAWLGTELDNIAANALYRSRGGTTDQMAYWEFDLR